MMTVHDLLERARASGQRLPAHEAGLLFSSAVRLASAQGATLRSRLVQLDDQGGLHLLPFDDQQPELEMGYLAPELLAADAPRKSEPRVQVYAAGVLGYEILTGSDPRNGVGGDPPAPLGDIVRMALSPDRRERFGDLTQLNDAVESAQPRLPAEQERQALATLLTRSGPGAAIEKEALAKLIAQFGVVQGQLSKLTAAQREMNERVDRFEDGQRLLPAAKRRAPVLVPLLAGLLGATAAIGGAWFLGFAPATFPHRAESVGEPPATPSAAEGAAAAPAAANPGMRAPVTGTAAAAAAPAKPDPAPTTGAAPTPGGSAASQTAASGTAAVDELAPGAAPSTNAGPSPDNAGGGTASRGTAGSAVPAPAVPAPVVPAPAVTDTIASTKVAPDKDGPGPPPAVDQDAPGTDSAGGSAAARPQRAPVAAPRPRPARASEVSPAMIAHAVAQSQVKRGESALEQSRIDEAIASFHTALENEPANAAALRGLGTAYSMQSNESMAIQSYEQYLRLAPSARDAGEIRQVIESLKARAKIGGGEEK